MSIENSNDTSGTGKVLPTSEDASQMPLNMLTDDLSGGLPGTPSVDATRGGMPGVLPVLILIIVIGSVVLWAMRVTGSSAPKPSEELSSAQTKIDEALKKLASTTPNATNLSDQSIETLFEDPKQVVAMFANDPVKSQVALSDLQKNPFKLTETAPTEAPIDNTGLVRQQKIQKLQDELGKLKLQSVIGKGSRCLASISGKVVRVGDPVGSFTVNSIEGHTVRLTAEGETFELSMARPSKAQ